MMRTGLGRLISSATAMLGFGLMGQQLRSAEPEKLYQDEGSKRAARNRHNKGKRKVYRSDKSLSRPDMMMADPGEGASRQLRRQFARLLNKPGRAEGGLPPAEPLRRRR